MLKILSSSQPHLTKAIYMFILQLLYLSEAFIKVEFLIFKELYYANFQFHTTSRLGVKKEPPTLFYSPTTVSLV